MPTRVLYPAVPTSHYPPTCPRMGAGAGYCPRTGDLGQSPDSVPGVAQKGKNLRVADRGVVSLVRGKTSVAMVLILTICGLVAASCSSPTVTRGSGKATGVTALGPDLTITTYGSTTTWTTTCREPTIPTGIPKTPITGCPLITLPTVHIHRPNPYDPGYHTVGQLVHDSFFIFVGVLLGTPSCTSGAAVSCYQPISVQKDLGGTDPRIGIGVPSAEVAAAKLTPATTYVFFWAVQTNPGDACIVGGVRGVMAYDAATNTVTRLDNSSDSRIPRSQTLDQLQSEIQQVEAATARAPEELPPAPVCSSSATGVPAS